MSDALVFECVGVCVCVCGLAGGESGKGEMEKKNCNTFGVCVCVRQCQKKKEHAVKGLKVVFSQTLAICSAKQ